MNILLGCILMAVGCMFDGPISWVVFGIGAILTLSGDD